MVAKPLNVVPMFCLNCQLYAPLRLNIKLTFLLERTADWDLNCKLSSFLIDSNLYIVSRTAKLIVKAVDLRTCYIEQIGVSCKGNIFI